jgi:RNA polymerase sigma-70 factor (ECF subfamily)
VAAGAVLAAVVALTLVGRDGGGDAAAAVALRHAAAVARQQSPPQAIAPGQFWYSKAIQAYLVIAGDRHGWVALDPKVREIWQGPTGGLLRERSAPPQFLSPSDREHWISAGRPEVSARAASDTLPPAEPLDLPTDPGLLYAKLHDEAVGNANGTSAEMLTEVGDALRETDASPALRAALYEVAARIPGVELVGPVHDRMGRPGLAVACSSAAGHERQELIFDPKTSALLGEEYRATAGNEFGYPAGTVVGYATYVSTGVANRLGARP